VDFSSPPLDNVEWMWTERCWSVKDRVVVMNEEISEDDSGESGGKLADNPYRDEVGVVSNLCLR